MANRPKKSKFPLDGQYTLLMALQNHLAHKEYATASVFAHTLKDIGQVFEVEPGTTEIATSIAIQLDDGGFSEEVIEVKMLENKDASTLADEDIDHLVLDWNKKYATALKTRLTAEEQAELNKRFLLDDTGRTERKRRIRESGLTRAEFESIQQASVIEFKEREKNMRKYAEVNDWENAAKEVGDVKPFIVEKLWNQGGDCLQYLLSIDPMKIMFWTGWIGTLYMFICAVKNLVLPDIWKLLSYDWYTFITSFLWRIVFMFLPTVSEAVLPTEANELVATGFRWYSYYTWIRFAMALPGMAGVLYLLLAGVLSGVTRGEWCPHLTSRVDQLGSVKDMVYSFMHRICLSMTKFTIQIVDNKWLNPDVICLIFKSASDAALSDARTLLGVDNSSTLSDIEKAYRRKTLEFHPDKTKGDDKGTEFIKLTEAFELLKKSKEPAGQE